MSGATKQRGEVLLTDHPWSATDLETDLCAQAGLELIVAPHGAGEDVLADLAPRATGILTCWAPVTRGVILGHPDLRVVSRMGVGLDNIDLAVTRDLGVTVTRVPDYCAEEVSDHVVGLIHAWARCILVADRDVRAGRWEPGLYAPRRVRDLIVGVWGTGTTGRRAAEKLAALGCEVLVDDHEPSRAPAGSTAVAVRDLLARADVVTLHLPLTPETRGIVGAAELATFRPGALLVNTSRGALVEIDALVTALDAGRPGAAALDVMPEEPVVPQALFRNDIILTPHIAFSSTRSVLDLRRRAVEDLLRVLAGEAPIHSAP
jgi:D-3-phosphoglycerate dehydrogenase